MSVVEYQFAPQPGPQTQFLSSPADIVIYGGAAGGGKTYGILLDGVRWAKNEHYNAGFFRRELQQLKSPGGLWEESKKMYAAFGGKPNNQELTWRFPSLSQHALIKMFGLQHADDILKQQGAQYDTIYLDELTHFLESQFWYLLSRLRSQGGKIKPYLRATCNPEPGWVLDLIEWWINDDGYPIYDRSGILRWFIRYKDNMHWFDSELDAIKWRDMMTLTNTIIPQSLTFIPARLEDNKILMERDPSYIGKLQSLGELERQKLLLGNWRIKPSGKLFKIQYFQQFHIAPDFDVKAVFVDTAQETKTANDYTVFQLWGKSKKNIYLTHQVRGKFEYDDQVDLLTSFIINHKPSYVFIEQKANGSALIQSVRRKITNLGLVCFVVAVQRSRDKYSRGFDCQGYIKAGYVFLNSTADYYTELVPEIVSFAPENKSKNVHDDQVDCLMDAIEFMLINPLVIDEQDDDDNYDFRHQMIA